MWFFFHFLKLSLTSHTGDASVRTSSGQAPPSSNARPRRRLTDVLSVPALAQAIMQVSPAEDFKAVW